MINRFFSFKFVSFIYKFNVQRRVQTGESTAADDSKLGTTEAQL